MFELARRFIKTGMVFLVLGVLLALGALTQALAVLLFVLNIWTRVRHVGKQV